MAHDERSRLVDEIDALYPADGPHADTAALGRQFLDEARREAHDWRGEPIEVLRRYAAKCRAEDHRQTERFLRSLPTF